MRIVVTRPQRSGERTAAKLEALGHEPVLLPLFHPAHHGERAISALSGPLAAIAVTSAEALRALETSRDRLAPHLSKPLFAVGATTAEAAKKAGFTQIFIASGDALGLIALVTQRRALLSEGQPLLYLAGRPRGSVFEEGLAAAGIPFRVIDCYEMLPSDISESMLQTALVENAADVVLLYSSEAARAFFNHASTDRYAAALAGTQFICISHNVLSLVPEIFRANAIAAREPSEAAMFELLHHNSGT
ncbi:uroporphyrinogen-III synthase [Agrobacterium radiobacter]|jgi:uroporphyrinogen-III synthase|uniref:Uroporphyrinogen-III synthase n=1 Tax=Agrobacterium tumefaciens str. B6 TaxID=1183423 RepID=A0A822V0C7_AGRTU|nr:uroporphyrinogen-III synthase [Agrobacterium tumefaciens]AYM06548.1 uroporphyrinogen III synthase HEM4 [Agrobacterium tumefaciens]KWT82328.1 uroporphyrinogen III synthase [Agrobacterium tumefaciens str. B6]MBP2572529.1 uroporphyrinogen-III synthase [Agrobacterium tumefaciens]MQB25617.1 uroporphyrinogen-III synthase [Agrobacterium tumefaciens]NSZ33565.1 uroporphyrinogen-III synthase [Agrobacterium tumefaciens]